MCRTPARTPDRRAFPGDRDQSRNRQLQSARESTAGRANKQNKSIHGSCSSMLFRETSQACPPRSALAQVQPDVGTSCESTTDCEALAAAALERALRTRIIQNATTALVTNGSSTFESNRSMGW